MLQLDANTWPPALRHRGPRPFPRATRERGQFAHPLLSATLRMCQQFDGFLSTLLCERQLVDPLSQLRDLLLGALLRLDQVAHDRR